jgi:hypothetical protein
VKRKQKKQLDTGLSDRWQELYYTVSCCQISGNRLNNCVKKHHLFHHVAYRCRELYCTVSCFQLSGTRGTNCVKRKPKKHLIPRVADMWRERYCTLSCCHLSGTRGNKLRETKTKKTAVNFSSWRQVAGPVLYSMLLPRIGNSRN